MKFSYCKKCAQITPSKNIPEYVVVNPTSREILKSGFDSFESARAWSNTAERSSSRVQEKMSDEYTCQLCNGSK